MKHFEGSLGRHWLIEYNECEANLLADPIAIQQIMEKAAQIMEATVVTRIFHHFTPLGVSGVVVIAESHLTIHTWPEYAYAAVDVFTCGVLKLEEGIAYLQEALSAQEVQIEKVKRGVKAYDKRIIS